MSQSNDSNTSGETKRTLSARNRDQRTRDLYNKPYKLPRQHLKYGSPSQIIRQLSRLPRNQAVPPPPEQSTPPTPVSKPLPTIQPIIQKPNRLTALELRKRESQFSQQDYEKALEKPNIHVRFFQRKHRHDEDGDTLSEITDRTTLSFSRFDRVFKDETVPKNHVLPPLPLPTRVLETQLQSQPVTVIESIVSKVGSEKHQQHEVLDELKPASGDEAEEVNIELKPADESNAETSNQSEPITPPLPLVESSSIDQDMAEDIPLQNDDHFDFTIDDDGFNMDMDYDQEDNEVASDTNVVEMIIEPRRKQVAQGDSFIRHRIRDTQADSSPNAFSARFSRELFLSKLDSSLRLRQYNFKEISNIFFDQMVDDLNSYKDNQPAELQGEITERDLILLMKRQRLIKDSSSLESLVHKHFPREYWDFVSKSALAYNEIYPHSDQEVQDITDDDDDDDDDADEI